VRLLERFIRKHGYKVTMIDRRPFGEVTMRFFEPKNTMGRIHCRWQSAKRIRRLRRLEEEEKV